MKPRVIALYLPQYYPFKENDEWWGKGFTEWTNVGRAVPLFKGHYQPRVPKDLGYYDLRLSTVREQQAQLAREAGIEGFCYWHYWFGNGKRLMETIFNEVLESGRPDFPFCLGWANHSWYAKNWNTMDTSGKDKLLIEQTYPGENDIRTHYELVLKAFKDPRYIKEENKPIFMIFDTSTLPPNFISLWNKWAKEDGFSGVFFIGNMKQKDTSDPKEYVKLGYNAVIRQRLTTAIFKQNRNKFSLILKKILSHSFGKAEQRISYKKASNFFIDVTEDSNENMIPVIIPNYDHSPRSGQYGVILTNSTPDLFYKHCKKAINLVKNKKNKIIILRSWNEWGEGNYMEPDTKYGHGYIDALKKAIDESI